MTRHVPQGHAARHSALPRWLRSASLAWAGALLACAVLALAAGFLLHEKRSLDATEIRSTELYARVLQDHTERAFNTIDIAMQSVADNVAAETAGIDANRSARFLARTLNGLPFLRSISLMSADGRVLASSSQGNVDLVVDLSRIRIPPVGQPDALSPPVHGRDLADVQAGHEPLSSAERNFLPLVRMVVGAGGRPLYAVAVLNPDFFANEHELTLADATRDAAIFSIDAVMVSATAGVQMRPGEAAKEHWAFVRFLPARESGSFVGPGVDGGKVVTAFRVLRKRPLVVVVETGYAQVLSGFRQTVLWTLGGCAAVIFVIAAMMVMGWRSLRGHEMVSAALDATRAEIASSERDLRALVESVHELIFRADAEGRIVFVNGRWTEIAGRPAHELVGKRLADLCRAGERGACDDLFRRRPAQAKTILIHVEGASGRPLTLEVSVSQVLDAQGAVLGFAGFAVDVSEREAAQSALQSQLRFTAQLLEISPTPIFVRDEHGRFATVNRAWLELMALSLPQVLGHTPSQLFADNPGNGELAKDDKSTTGGTLTYEHRLRAPGRPARDTVVTEVPFTRADGTAAGIVGSIVDVTEFREAERTVRKARDAAQRASHAKSEFIANISHELRTPLQGIIGFSEIGREQARETPLMVDLFADIHAAGRRMLTLVNGLLAVSQMDSSVGSLPLSRADIVPLVRDAVDALAPSASLRGVSFKLAGLGGAVQADVHEERLRQALSHVLCNALRYSPAGGVVELALKDQGAGGIELSVRDHGPGVPEDELELVFEAFVQSSRTRDGSGGAGLGLTVTRKIMSAHGGRVSLANAPGGGAIVRLSLPAPGAACEAREGPGETCSGGRASLSEVN